MKKKEIKKIWHYTIVNYLPSILKNGIKIAKTNVPKGEKPVVWFSTNQIWEETANKSYISNGELKFGNKEETKNRGGGLIRIEVSPKTAPLSWKQFVAMKHIKKKTAKNLISRTALNGADPNDWRISFRKVTHEKILSVECFYSDELGWIDISEVLSPVMLEIIKNNPNITGVEFIEKCNS